jgi:hypothetical protein
MPLFPVTLRSLCPDHIYTFQSQIFVRLFESPNPHFYLQELERSERLARSADEGFYVHALFQQLNKVFALRSVARNS